MRLLILLSCCAAFLSCDSNDSKTETQPVVELQSELNENLALWESRNIKTYQFTYRRLSFSVPGDNIVITVTDEVIVDAYYRDTDQVLSEEQILYLPTIEELFQEIQKGIDEDYVQLLVNYDEGDGYPEDISIDVNIMIADEEVSHIVSDFLIIE